MNENIDFLTTKQAAARLSVTSRTLLRWADTGVVAVYRMGGNVVRFDAADVTAFLTTAHKEVAQ